MECPYKHNHPLQVLNISVLGIMTEYAMHLRYIANLPWSHQLLTCEEYTSALQYAICTKEGESDSYEPCDSLFPHRILAALAP